MTSTESHAVDEYISSLSDLKTNFKPLINVLTILAEENVEYAPAIVEAIENHLQQVWFYLFVNKYYFFFLAHYSPYV